MKQKTKLKIKNLKLKNRVFLAPMAEVNDIAFRILCKKAGAGLVYTGMINPRTKEKLVLDDKPAIQIFTTSTQGVKEFIKKYEKKASLFDLNLGCPAYVARKCGFGAFMHGKLDVIEDVLKIMRETTKKPITIKIRKSAYSAKLLKLAEKYCDALCIHPRTREQGYSGRVDLDFAKKIKRKTTLPVIYSGDVDENNMGDLLNNFDFVMVGRAALGHPDVFEKINNNLINNKEEMICKSPPKSVYQLINNHLCREAQPDISSKASNISFKQYLSLARKYKLKFRHIKTQAMYFTSGKEDAKELRRNIALAKTIDDVERVYGY